MPGQEPLHWFIREVTPLNAATIEMLLDDAALSFEWRFEGLICGRTRLRQRVAAFTANLADSMNKLATAIANADPSQEAGQT
jgi:hypothetical protein